MTTEAYDVAIVGGGPGGSALAIQLAERGRRVLLLEKETMPRDKLCGEFLSTEVRRLCSSLGILEAMLEAHARPIEVATCTSPNGRSVTVDLPGTAFGLSRRTLDHLLFERARVAGATTIDNAPVASISGSLDAGFHLELRDNRQFSARVAVGAYGRRSRLDRKLERPSLQSKSPYVAFKAHFRGAMPEKVIEVHAFGSGYCGLLIEEKGLVNVCWIVHKDRLKEAGGSPESMIHGMPSWNGPLAARLDDLEPIEPYHAASQLEFSRKELFANDVCLIGDAAGMIAPLCGDGMAMAMRSAELCAPLIHSFLAGRIRSTGFKVEYRKSWTREFNRRMFVGRMIHAVMVRPLLLEPGLTLLHSFPSLAEAIVSSTRGERDKSTSAGQVLRALI